MDGFERRRQRKKEDILNATLDLSKEYGLNKVSIGEIARKASVSQVSIYNFFESKENLVKELLRRLLEDHVKRTVEIVDTPDPAKLRLEKLLESRIDYFRSYSAKFIAESMLENPYVKEFMESEDYKKVMKSIYNLFEQGKMEGVFEPSISTEVMVTYIETFQSYMLNNPSFITKLDHNPEFASEIFQLFINGLLKK